MSWKGPQELAGVDLETVGETADDVQGRVAPSPLDAGDVRPVHAHLMGESLLRESAVLT